MCSRARSFVGLLLTAIWLVPACEAAQTDLHGPAGSVSFGSSVTVLPNGNFVVTDPAGPVSGIGAVYLYSPTGTLISTLTGSTANDNVGSYGVTVVGGSNFVVNSKQWHNNTGAVTWVNGSTGLNDVVSSANSLVGSIAGDRVGSGFVTVLSNGNYVVASPHWDNGTSNAFYGAATWGSGTAGVSGVVSAVNSLVGASAGDTVSGSTFSNTGFVVALSNGNYVVGSPLWHNAGASVGAATWGSGVSGTVGMVTSGNSLIGSTAADGVGTQITALSNGNYVVGSPAWQNAGAQVGAATWVSGAGAFSGSVSSDGAAASKSLIGTSNGDHVSSGGIVALNNGNYVVVSPQWNGSIGAVTWGNGASGTASPVLPGNSLTGTTGGTSGDGVGSGGVSALTNGTYVVGSPSWNNGSTQVGAATWVNGSAAFSATVQTSNSLFGTTSGDGAGIRITALADGNYVVSLGSWNDGVTNGHFGAAAWGDGATGMSGPVLPGKSLIGAAANDEVGINGALALKNGAYVVLSYQFADGATSAVGAWTWSRPGGGTVGTVSASNSVIGLLASGYGAIGTGGARVFADGYYAIASPNFAGAHGAVTLASGAFRLKGTIASWNSVIGGVANQGGSLVYDYDATRHRLIVGRPSENLVSLFTTDQIFADDFDP